MVKVRIRFLAILLMTGCSNPNIYHEGRPTIAYPIMNSTNDFRGGVIDHTVDELRQMNDQKYRSITPNDADKVYNQRFIEDLARHRDQSCQH